MTDRKQHSATSEDLARHFLCESEESARLFLKQSWISHLVSTLRSARLAAGLTQADLAEKLGTTQSAIARLENDDTGGLSIRRMIDYALACDVALFDLSVEDVEQLRRFALDSPDGEHTERAYLKWQAFVDDNAGSSIPQSLPTEAPQTHQDECYWASVFDKDSSSIASEMESSEQPLYSDQLVESEYSSNMNAARRRWSDEEMNFIDSEPYGIEAMAA